MSNVNPPPFQCRNSQCHRPLFGQVAFCPYCGCEKPWTATAIHGLQSRSPDTPQVVNKLPVVTNPPADNASLPVVVNKPGIQVNTGSQLAQVRTAQTPTVAADGSDDLATSPLPQQIIESARQARPWYTRKRAWIASLIGSLAIYHFWPTIKTSVVAPKPAWTDSQVCDNAPTSGDPVSFFKLLPNGQTLATLTVRHDNNVVPCSWDQAGLGRALVAAQQAANKAPRSSALAKQLAVTLAQFQTAQRALQQAARSRPKVVQQPTPQESPKPSEPEATSGSQSPPTNTLAAQTPEQVRTPESQASGSEPASGSQPPEAMAQLNTPQPPPATTRTSPPSSSVPQQIPRPSIAAAQAPPTLLRQYITLRFNGKFSSGDPAREAAFATQALAALDPVRARNIKGNEIGLEDALKDLRASTKTAPPFNQLVLGMFIQLDQYDSQTSSFPIHYPLFDGVAPMKVGGQVFRGASGNGVNVNIRGYSATGTACTWWPPKGFPARAPNEFAAQPPDAGFFLMISACRPYPPPEQASVQVDLTSVNNELPLVIGLIPPKGSLWTRLSLQRDVAQQLISKMGGYNRLLWTELRFTVGDLRQNYPGPYTMQMYASQTTPPVMADIVPLSLTILDTYGSPTAPKFLARLETHQN